MVEEDEVYQPVMKDQRFPGGDDLGENLPEVLLLLLVLRIVAPVVSDAEAVLGAEVKAVLDEELKTGGLHDVILGAENQQVVRGH